MENKKYIESIGQAYQQVQEKLKGGQKKLDKDGDGDIDGTDFAMMRKKKKMDEADYDAKKDHDMDPTSHVMKDKETGKFCVYDVNNKKVKEFDTKPEADAYAKKNHDDLMKKEQADCDTPGRKTRKEDEEIVMNPKKKKEKGEKAMSSDSNMAQEDTKWPIYQRIMEKNVVNQNAVPPQPMIPAEKQLKDHEGETVNQSQDHISAAAAQWIKDHEGNQVPDDAVDHEKVVAKNAQDAMRTVPNQAKDEVNKKAAKAETMKKVEEK